MHLSLVFVSLSSSQKKKTEDIYLFTYLSSQNSVFFFCQDAEKRGVPLTSLRQSFIAVEEEKEEKKKASLLVPFHGDTHLSIPTQTVRQETHTLKRPVIFLDRQRLDIDILPLLLTYRDILLVLLCSASSTSI